MIKYNKLGRICGKYNKVMFYFSQVIWYRTGKMNCLGIVKSLIDLSFSCVSLAEEKSSRIPGWRDDHCKFSFQK